MVNIKLAVPNENGNKAALSLNHALYSSEAGVNMLLCAQIYCDGVSTIFTNSRCFLVYRYNKNTELGYATKRREDNLHVVKGKAMRSIRKVAMACTNQKAQKSLSKGLELGHCRLGHVYNKSVKRMTSGVVEGVDGSKKPETI